ncbi:toxin glutamine deamidase domain-containing protein [Streptomyces cyaneus]|uniref:toxin glutamine deamidase domain-containing protein n=1 Tax=Streptomyces cyaneus TaxID=1904 RepID=UPI003CCC4795
MGNGRDAFNRLENTLRNSGHGSQAVIITQDANGLAHAWNAVNHNGKITYIDAQTGQQSSKPLHSGNNGVFAIPLDGNRQLVSPDGGLTGDHSRPDSTDQADRQTPGTPAGADRRPPRIRQAQIRRKATRICPTTRPGKSATSRCPNRRTGLRSIKPSSGLAPTGGTQLPERRPARTQGLRSGRSEWPEGPPHRAGPGARQSQELGGRRPSGAPPAERRGPDGRVQPGP